MNIPVTQQLKLEARSLEEQYPLYQLIAPDGTLSEEGQAHYDVGLMRQIYAQMLRARLFDRKCVNLQRQGRIGTYAPFEGQEAAQVGSALALDEKDWLFPTYRDHAATLTFGHSMVQVLLYWAARMEGCVPPEGKHIFPPSVPIATQIPHAVGAAWAEKMKGSRQAAIVYFGDGATSEGDFHEGLNFASVFHVPVVFFCQNNGFAISVPMERQMRSKTIAQKALAYDLAGIRVDGNDGLAVYTATKTALQRAREEGEPTLIEAVTWRYGAHTTADDPTKYRDQKESEQRRIFDPLDRMEKALKKQGDWDEEWAQALRETFTREIDEAVKSMEAYPQADPADMFKYVFEEPTWNLQEQRKVFESYPGEMKSL
ncbi:pyruvate dehydrogenase (acetyl-transferring) E1 component, alpha subunit [Caldalkalibacillus thermarum TA2.A1]|uniref:Pyruvate dehydrogenase E1 component subunit alpha n=1 Tax=Caldalkalibacillus thermarum (strain TA2.A1) TaxID=986075 RepID=F5L9G1_CALTT|nr:pyruvate dehydrogenase (acetyl-transferring) E1 component subunit alpha [Caldalkalibacillus thermarum]EGL81948.1 pyruvate dehydrogenase (acetyl-transferring) E1 component, alpha subunit [Caldalkalibacillus thermarum TA2.A1]QZT34479.1 pyruvate dehydrogenase (acetyl-transferring) E1 component subunit alpha [Caldalkalibacillus thermarum TA2.A1]